MARTYSNLQSWSILTCQKFENPFTLQISGKIVGMKDQDFQINNEAYKGYIPVQ